ncbi:CrcB family protein [Mannheimia haemolytica]|uniref:fluoride efflux transporter FluC n=1 Tax=Mannheimia haemolytica TaxID=75985 RepID=UPI000589F3FC|nr:CrcB family protein [Mannheimia haemolytica]KYL11386.1 chromosome condensation protein CrcB [Mannheimia haemolytica]UFK43109.1 CrcB family protein [Mannheimia haemolytica]UQX64115.1 CrcB family protein [Mannheimia haemolytica]
MSSILMISIGAVLGAMCRWQLAVWLNPILSQFAFGTLAANWLGCLLIGIAMGFNLGESQRLLFISGFLGSFTTFSSFSLELTEKLLAAKWGQFVTVLSLHLIGGLLLTLIGVMLARAVTSGRFC